MRHRDQWLFRVFPSCILCKNHRDDPDGSSIGRIARKGGAMSRKKAKMLFWAALVVLAYIPYLMQSASHAVM